VITTAPPAIAVCVAQASRSYEIAPARLWHQIRDAKGGVGVAHVPKSWIPILRDRASFVRLAQTDPRSQATADCLSIYAAGWIMETIQIDAGIRTEMINWQRGHESLSLLRRAQPWIPMIREASFYTGVPAPLIEAVISQESGFNPRAVSSAGAEGLMQLMPATARRMGVTDPMNPAQNIFGGAVLLKRLTTRFSGRLSLILAAYNAGSAAVDQYGGVPPYRQTMNYVPSVESLYRTWQANDK
jgi:soluble lytic murein transglycosylase-like protein